MYDIEGKDKWYDPSPERKIPYGFTAKKYLYDKNLNVVNPPYENNENFKNFLIKNKPLTVSNIIYKSENFNDVKMGILANDNNIMLKNNAFRKKDFITNTMWNNYKKTNGYKEINELSDVDKKIALSRPHPSEFLDITGTNHRQDVRLIRYALGMTDKEMRAIPEPISNNKNHFYGV